MKTIRLFDEDTYLKEFEARIVSRSENQGKQGIVLDQTLFYPTSGGQPADRGVLGDVPVVDVFEEGETIVHVLNGKIENESRVRGEIDWDRRIDHMQQHTGQHILSQAFVHTADARTVGFHLGEESSTIDLRDIEASEDLIRRTESLSNGIVLEGRDVVVRQVPQDRIHTIPFRKRPKAEGPVRVVEVEDFDYSGCCGTHVRKTSEVGIIKVIRWERYKGGARITFLCGWRALEDYQKKTVTLREICRNMTVGEGDVLSAVVRWKEEKKEAVRRIRSLLDESLENEAIRLKEKAETIGSVRVIRTCFKDRDPGEVQNLVKKLSRLEGVVALIGLKRERAYIFFGRSPSVEADMKRLMEEACREMDGKGGGSPAMAQGSSKEISKLEAALDRAMSFI